MSKWRSAKAFSAWLGLCPRNKISGRKVLDTRTCKVISRVATTLRLAAQSLGRTNTALGLFYRRKRAHLGPAKATTATARKLACLVYHLLKYKEQYREPDPATYQLKVQKTILAKIQKQAAALGYKLLLPCSRLSSWEAGRFILYNYPGFRCASPRLRARLRRGHFIVTCIRSIPLGRAGACEGGLG